MKNKFQISRYTIGVLINQVEGHFQSLLWKGMDSCAREKNANLFIFAAGAMGNIFEGDEFSNVVYELAKSKALDGLIVFGGIGSYISHQVFYEKLYDYREIPKIIISECMESTPSLMINDRGGMKKNIDHLIDVHGYENIIFITGPSGNNTSSERFNGYLESLKEHNIPYRPEMVIEGNFMYEFGEKAVKIIMDERKLDFDAIACANDEMAIGVFYAMEKRGFYAPRNYALTGFDNIRETEFFPIPITTVNQPIFEEGRKSVELIINLIEGEKIPENTLLETELVIRRSCGCFTQEFEPKNHENSYVEIYKDKQLTAEIEERNKLLKRKNEIIEEVLTTFDKNIISESLKMCIDALLDSFYTDFEKERKTNYSFFLLVLEDILEKNFKDYGQLIIWKEAVPKLDKILSSRIFKQEMNKIKINSIFEKANNLVNDYIIRFKTFKTEEIQKYFFSLRKFLFKLDYTFHFSKIAESLFEGLQKHFKIKSAFLILFKNEERKYDTLPLQSSVLLAYDERGRLDKKEGNIFFFTRQIISPTLITESKRYSLLFLTLFTKLATFGYIAFEISEEIPAFLYPIIAERISNAIQTAQIFEEKENVTDELNKALARLRKSEEKYKEMTETLPLGIIETDLNHEILYILYINNTAKNILKINDNFEKINFIEFVIDKNKFYEYCNYTQNKLDSNFSDFILKTTAGETKTLICKATLIMSHENFISGYRWLIIEFSSFLKSSIYPKEEFYQKFSITNREKEVIECLLQGLRISEIANKLFITTGTVKDHLTSIYKKTNTSNKKELFDKIKEYGFLKLEGLPNLIKSEEEK